MGQTTEYDFGGSEPELTMRGRSGSVATSATTGFAIDVINNLSGQEPYDSRMGSTTSNADDIDEVVYKHQRRSSESKGNHGRFRKKTRKGSAFDIETLRTPYGNAKKHRPSDSAKTFSNGRDTLCMCGWCGKTLRTLQALGGHVTLHRFEPDYPVMPPPEAEFVDDLVGQGYFLIGGEE